MVIDGGQGEAVAQGVEGHSAGTHLLHCPQGLHYQHYRGATAAATPTAARGRVVQVGGIHDATAIQGVHGGVAPTATLTPQAPREELQEPLAAHGKQHTSVVKPPGLGQGGKELLRLSPPAIQDQTPGKGYVLCGGEREVVKERKVQCGVGCLVD